MSEREPGPSFWFLCSGRRDTPVGAAVRALELAVRWGVSPAQW